jgi:DNA polymerase
MVVTYHPAYLLRSLSEKSRAWADLCLAREVFEAAAVDAAALDAAAVDMAAVDTAAVDTAAVAGRPAPTASTDGQH